MSGVCLHGVSYVLGEHEIGYTDIPGLPELAAKYGLAMNAQLWGWGCIRATSRDLAGLAAESCRATAAAAAAPADALVFCSTRVPACADDHGSFLARVLTGAGLGAIPAYSQTLGRCLNLLTGIDLAAALVTSGRYERVLVVTADAVAPGAPAMSQFALYSAAAASCLITAAPAPAAPAPSYEILGCAAAQDTAQMDPASQISSDLAREVTDALLRRAGLRLADITAVAHLNLFRPLVAMKERQAGFTPDQLYLDNIPRTGHCFAADPLISLADQTAAGRIAAGQYCLLAASAPGQRAGVLLRRPDEEGAGDDCRAC